MVSYKIYGKSPKKEVDDKKCILLISDSLGSNNTVFVKSIYDCNQIIKEFKHANNWNKPINN